MWLLMVLITVLSQNTFADQMDIDRPARHVKFNLAIDIISAQMVSSYLLDEDMQFDYGSLEIQVEEPDADFIMLDREDFIE